MTHNFLSVIFLDAEKPKLSPTNTRALARMKQTLRKNNTTYAEQMAAFRQNPESPEPSEASSSESEADSSDSAEDDLDSDAEAEKQFRTVRTGVVARPKDKILSMDPKEISYEMVQRKLKEVAAARGRSTALDRQDQAEMLSYLAGVARGPAQKLQVLVHLITVTFDMNQPLAAPMTVVNWKRCMATLFEVIDIAEDNPTILLVDEPPEEEEERIEEPAAGEMVKVWGNPAAFLERVDEEWTGSLKALDPHANAYMERMRDEPALLALAGKVSAYLGRQAGHRGLPNISAAAAAKLPGVALRSIDHLYYKTRPVYEATRKMAMALRDEQQTAASTTAAAATTTTVSVEEPLLDGDADGAVPLPVVKLPADFELPVDATGLLDSLAHMVFTKGNDNQKGQAMLSLVYFKAIHDDFYAARDMLLMSRIAEQTQQLDTKMQVLFNRTTAQLGLCAFRAGLIQDSHNCLADLYGSGKVKELLAQGIQQHHRYGEKTPEQEAAERRRQVPFHLHINLELLEASYLTSATLLEIPHIAALGVAESKKRAISKPLRRLFENYEKQTFIGPAENVRDHIMAACRALSTGDWRHAYDYITSLQCWSLLGSSRQSVMDMLKVKFQVEGLRTYLLANARFYTSLSMKQLCEMFDLPDRKVHAIVSKMIADEALPGSHDQPTGTVVIHHEEPTRLQALASQCATQAALLVDLNERALALRTGVLHTDEEDEGGRRSTDGQQGSRRTRMGGRALGGAGRGRGRGRGRFGPTAGSGAGFVADAGFSGGVFGRGRASRAQQRDDSNYTQLGRVGNSS